MLSDSDKAAAFSAHSPAYRLLPSTLSDRLWAFLCLLGGGDVAVCGVIHKLLLLFFFFFGAKGTNYAQNRPDCVFFVHALHVTEKFWSNRNGFEKSPPASILDFSVDKSAVCCRDVSSILAVLAE